VSCSGSTESTDAFGAASFADAIVETLAGGTSKKGDTCASVATWTIFSGASGKSAPETDDPGNAYPSTAYG